MYTVDLHLHTYYSDGVYSPAEVVRMAKKEGVTKLSITDHDGIRGLSEARAEASAADIEFVSGIEFSTEYKKELDLHILGHGFDENDNGITCACNNAMKARRERNERLLYALKKEGYEITTDELYAGTVTDYIGKPHIAAVLFKKGMIKDEEYAFANIFERPSIASIKKEVMTAAEAIDLINKAGGRATLAHPGKTKGVAIRGSEEFFDKMEEIIRTLCSHGLGGLECCHSNHADTERVRFADIAQKYRLEITSGSDFHG